MRRIVLVLMVVGCAEAGKRADTPAGPQIAEAPPTSGTEATAPPQPAPELAHPASPESKTTRDDPPTKAQLASSPAPQPPAGKPGSPTITKGKIEVAGGGKADTDMVTRYLNKNAANFQLCYEKPLLGNPAIEGQVTLVFDVDATGKVSKRQDDGQHERRGREVPRPGRFEDRVREAGEGRHDQRQLPAHVRLEIRDGLQFCKVAARNRARSNKLEWGRSTVLQVTTYGSW